MMQKVYALWRFRVFPLACSITGILDANWDVQLQQLTPGLLRPTQLDTYQHLCAIIIQAAWLCHGASLAFMGLSIEHLKGWWTGEDSKSTTSQVLQMKMLMGTRVFKQSPCQSVRPNLTPVGVKVNCCSDFKLCSKDRVHKKQSCWDFSECDLV